MRTSALLVLLVLLFVVGIASPLAGSQTPADGFYRVTPQGSLGDRVSYQILSARVVSDDNLNKHFRVQFTTPYLNVPDGDLDKSVLVLAGRRFETWKSGWAGEPKTSTYTVEVETAASAQVVAQFFKVEPQLRRHPGYRLATSFRPTREQYRRGENVIVTMTVANVGTEPVFLLVGGRDRGFRDNQFGFSLVHNGRGVPDTGAATHLGGLVGTHMLRPGETLTGDANLSLWFDTTSPGFYEAVGTYAVSFVADASSFDVIWTDVLAGEFAFERAKE